ncbi:uncharacterized protein EV422DRAFT_169565 [Fimicolochytrium jonesii]|uniref:uncharacterized protein n=1 Tax=Fimicolochytrium jonesii TaxID=1396493 RepID=UPI0022FDC9DB|nr:uncharacterized protein EV422DRAFT_169565 [Fimicolochytrium jonesii]KAI8818491.1 hypothetical protein EV422DRAFT_169565 [Fimicolochytrium jonesii]
MPADTEQQKKNNGKAPVDESALPKWKSYGPDGQVYITEGAAKIEFPSDNSVFYNPVQEFNRDMVGWKRRAQRRAGLGVREPLSV